MRPRNENGALDWLTRAASPALRNHRHGLGRMGSGVYLDRGDKHSPAGQGTAPTAVAPAAAVTTVVGLLLLSKRLDLRGFAPTLTSAHLNAFYDGPRRHG
jgi:hypothetical protein